MEPLDPKTKVAVAQFDSAVAKNPQDQRAFFNMGLWWHWKGNYAKALEHYNEAIRLSPTFAYALSARASLRATCPDPTWRDGDAALDDATKAMRYAAEAGEMDGSWKQRQYLQVLAAAHAENGSFPEAIHWQTEALKLAITKRAIKNIRSRLALYETSKPARDEGGLVRMGIPATDSAWSVPARRPLPLTVTVRSP
jgi:tetratricopeptide (TPR) repeat protein